MRNLADMGYTTWTREAHKAEASNPKRLAVINKGRNETFVESIKNREGEQNETWKGRC